MRPMLCLAVTDATIDNLQGLKFWVACPWETNILKTLWEKEKLLVTSNFSFS